MQLLKKKSYKSRKMWKIIKLPLKTVYPLLMVLFFFFYTQQDLWSTLA